MPVVISRFHAKDFIKVKCSNRLPMAAYNNMETKNQWFTKYHDSPATSKRYCNYLWMSELLYWVLHCSTTEWRTPQQGGAANQYVLVIWGAFWCIYNQFDTNNTCVALVSLFSAVYFQMYLQIACSIGGITTLVAFISSDRSSYSDSVLL